MSVRQRFRAVVGVAILLSVPSAVFAPTVSSTAATAPAPTKLAVALTLVPDTAANRRMVEVTDLDAVRKTAGAARSTNTKDRTLGAIIVVARRKMNVPAPFGLGANAIELAANLATIGLTLDTATASVSAGEPPDVVSGLVGKFDSTAIVTKASKCSACPVKARVAASGQTKILAWSDDPSSLDLANRLKPPVFDELGRAPLLAVNLDFVVKAYSDATLRAALKAQGGTQSLAKNADFANAAKNLDRLGALTAVVTDRTQAAAPGESGSLLLRPYRLLGLGLVAESDGPALAIVLVHADAASARQNVDRLRARVKSARSERSDEPWSTLFPKTEIQADGTILRAVLRGPGAASFTAFLYSNDPLLGHEPA